MATDFPGALDTYTDPTNGNFLNNPSHSGQHQNHNDSIEAIEAKVGTGASTPTSDTFMIGNGTGTSAWSALTSAQLRARLSDETGTGVAVFATNPEFVGADMNGTKLILDADADTSITADTDDQIDIEISGADDFRFTANDFKALSGSTISTDTISETTSANGVTIDGLNIKDNKLTTADSVVTANYTDGSILPEHLVSGTGTSWAWQSWTPTWTNLTVSGSTVVAKYIQIGKTVFFRVSVVLGSGNAPTGGVTLTLPVTAASTYEFDAANGEYVGEAHYLDTSNAAYGGTVRVQSSTIAKINVWNSGGTYITGNELSSSVPFTWGDGDKIFLKGTYEAA